MAEPILKLWALFNTLIGIVAAEITLGAFYHAELCDVI